MRPEPLNFFIIPGNPPAVRFYEMWREDFLRLQPAAKFCISAYPALGFANDSVEFFKKKTAHHLEQLQKFHHQTQSSVLVLGHSLGGYFSLQLLDKASPLIHKVFLIHPFLREPTKKGLRLLKFLRLFHGRMALQKFTVSIRKVLELLSEELKELSDQEILTALNVIEHEYQIIARDRSELLLAKELRGKIHLFYTPQDIWHSADLIQRMQGQVEITHCAEPHDFVVSPAHRESLAKQILQLTQTNLATNQYDRT